MLARSDATVAPGSRVAITSRTLSAELQRRRRSARVITLTRPVAIPPYVLKEPRLAQEHNRPARAQPVNVGATRATRRLRLFPFVEVIFADGAYQGQATAEAVARTGRWRLEIVKRSDRTGFVPLPIGL